MYSRVVALCSSLRTVLAFAVCVALLPLADFSRLVRGRAQGFAQRAGQAKRGKITQSWNGQPSHQWVSFGWGTRTMQSSFTSGLVVGTVNNSVLPVITQVSLNDTSYFTFDYTNSLQVSAIRNYFGAMERNATIFTYETPAGDVPRLLDTVCRRGTGVE
jgi:hypothetical protein